MWKEKLLRALGPNGQVIIEVIPEVELILGEQPEVPELPPNQAHNRFNFVFQNFVRTFAAPEHPLVIFLDDLQWVDSPSLSLIEVLMNDRRTQDMLIIGAYRDNEVSDAHPLMLKLKDIRQAGATVNTITLGPLHLEDVNQLIADTLHSQNKFCTPLAELALQKTGGNPFFLLQFLHSLYEDQLITFDRNHRVWQWGIEAIRKAEITDNVVDLMAGKIQKLPEETQHVLQLAACIGNQFDLHTLSIVYEKTETETLRELWNALQDGLVLPLDDTYKYVGMDIRNSKLETRNSELATPVSSFQFPVSNFKFSHDRVQQAAYSLIEEGHKQAVHLKIGRLLLANLSEAEREERVFEIVDHVNTGKDLLTEQAEKEKLAELNLMAGRKAKDSAAYQATFTYLQNGISLLEAEDWQRQYDLTLALHVEAAEAAYLNRNFEEMEQLFEIVIKNANTLLDEVKVCEVKIQAYISQNKLLEAVQTALSVLRFLGVKLPQKPNGFYILLDLLVTKLFLAGRQFEDFINLPEMTAPYKLATMRILSHLIIATYIAFPELFPLVVFKQLRLSVKHGNTPASTFAYAGYGLILCRVLRDIESGYRFGKLALELLNRFNSEEFRARTVLTVNNFVMLWKEHARDILHPLQVAYQTGLETGDLEIAAFSAFLYSYNSYVTGKKLTGLSQEMASYSETIGQLKQEVAFQSTVQRKMKI